MTRKIIGAQAYYSSQEVAELWGLKHATVKKYASKKVGKIPGCKIRDGVLYIPENAIRPITQPVAQGLIWSLIHLKNDPSVYIDLTEYGISNDQMRSVLTELGRQLYIDLDGSLDDVREQMLAARITEKGFSLVEYRRRYKENPTQQHFTAEMLSLAFSGAQTIMQLIELLDPYQQ